VTTFAAIQTQRGCKPRPACVTMSPMKLLFALAVTALAGCVGQVYGAGGGSRTIPPRPAGVSYPNWEHICITFNDPDSLNHALNGAGDQGWEVAAMASQVVCFKRPRADSPNVALPAAAAPAAAAAPPAR
jgi:hypothetical protein